MSTRGAIGFIVDGKEKITYNHSDSYPDGLGIDVLAFIAAVTLEQMREKARAITVINEQSKPTSAQVARCKEAGVYDGGVGGQSERDWYCLLRGAQGDLAKYLEIGLMPDGHTFVHDSLFCEWAYIVNLDTSKLEVYRGFNHNPKAPGRYASIIPDKKGQRDMGRGKKGDPFYCGVELIDELDLEKLHETLAANPFAKDKVSKIVAGISSGWQRVADERYEDQKKRYAA